MKVLTLKDYKEIRTPFVFFDETGSLNDKINRFFCLGMVKCMQPFYLDSSIREIRQIKKDIARILTVLCQKNN